MAIVYPKVTFELHSYECEILLNFIEENIYSHIRTNKDYDNIYYLKDLVDIWKTIRDSYGYSILNAEKTTEKPVEKSEKPVENTKKPTEKSKKSTEKETNLKRIELRDGISLVHDSSIPNDILFENKEYVYVDKEKYHYECGHNIPCFSYGDVAAQRRK